MQRGLKEDQRRLMLLACFDAYDAIQSWDASRLVFASEASVILLQVAYGSLICNFPQRCALQCDRSSEALLELEAPLKICSLTCQQKCILYKGDQALSQLMRCASERDTDVF